MLELTQSRRPVAGSALFVLSSLVLILGASCLSPSSYYKKGGREGSAGTIRPVVGVMDFENRANFSGRWDIGSGMAELLVTELIDTGDVTVLERQHLNDVVGEILRQGQDLFRKEGRVERGRLMNAKFLIRGVVTDFTITSEARGWFGIKSFRARGGGSRTRVAISLKVSDVETGEIISSVKSDASVSAGGFGGDYTDKNMAFGGDTFFRTPIGRATESAIQKAVKQILAELPPQYWEPRVAEAGLDTVVINGGENVDLKHGDLFVIRERGRSVTDPVTGNVLEDVPGKIVGRVEVRAVKPLSSHAIILDGKASRGQILEPVEP